MIIIFSYQQNSDLDWNFGLKSLFYLCESIQYNNDYIIFFISTHYWLQLYFRYKIIIIKKDEFGLICLIYNLNKKNALDLMGLI